MIQKLENLQKTMKKVSMNGLKNDQFQVSTKLGINIQVNNMRKLLLGIFDDCFSIDEIIFLSKKHPYSRHMISPIRSFA